MRVVFLAAAGVGAGLVLHQVLRRIDDLVSAPRRRFRSRHGDVGVGPRASSSSRAVDSALNRQLVPASTTLEILVARATLAPARRAIDANDMTRRRRARDAVDREIAVETRG